MPLPAIVSLRKALNPPQQPPATLKKPVCVCMCAFRKGWITSGSQITVWPWVQLTNKVILKSVGFYNGKPFWDFVWSWQENACVNTAMEVRLLWAFSLDIQFFLYIGLELLLRSSSSTPDEEHISPTVWHTKRHNGMSLGGTRQGCLLFQSVFEGRDQRGCVYQDKPPCKTPPLGIFLHKAPWHPLGPRTKMAMDH